MKIEKTDAERIDAAIDLIEEYSTIDLARHGTWALDQVLRVLAGDRYGQIVADIRGGWEGPDTYLWDEGTAP